MSQSYNFCFPVRVLENDRLKLEPFNATKYAEPVFEGMSKHPQIWKFLPSGPWSTSDELQTQLLDRIEDNTESVLYTVLVKPQAEDEDQTERFAGLIGFLNSSAVNASTEIGWVIVWPEYQRTFVATNAVGLMLLYGLDPPSKGGLGLRRVQWQATAENKASIGLAKRMLMTHEGIARWQRVIALHKLGNGVDTEKLSEAERYTSLEGGVQGPGRHTAVLSMCWDDWLVDGKREQVLKLMDRRS